MNSHLVAVEVGVERRANERMQLNRLTFDQHRLESLNAESVKRRRAVQHHRMFADHFFQNVPHHGRLVLNLVATPITSSLLKMNGLNSSSAISFGRPH